MSQVNHKHVLKFYKLVSNGKLRSKSGETHEVTYGLLELSSGGELFSILFNTGKFNENLSLFYAKQLAHAIDYLHERKIAH